MTPSPRSAPFPREYSGQGAEVSTGRRCAHTTRSLGPAWVSVHLLSFSFLKGSGLVRGMCLLLFLPTICKPGRVVPSALTCRPLSPSRCPLQAWPGSPGAAPRWLELGPRTAAPTLCCPEAVLPPAQPPLCPHLSSPEVSSPWLRPSSLLWAAWWPEAGRAPDPSARQPLALGLFSGCPAKEPGGEQASVWLPAPSLSSGETPRPQFPPLAGGPELTAWSRVCQTEVPFPGASP